MTPFVLPEAGLSSELSLNEAIDKAQEALLACQHPEGYWSFPVEVDVTITAESLLLRRFLEIWDSAIAEKASRYLFHCQNEDGGWPLFYGGPSDVSASVKAYFALKLAGFSPEEPRMVRANRMILALGGIEAANVFTKYQLALFGQFPWQGAPAMPLEVFAFPNKFYFSLANISYWSRTVLVPLLVVLHFRPQIDLDSKFHVNELYIDLANKESYSLKVSAPLFSYRNFFLMIDKALHLYEKFPWKPWRKNILKEIENWLVTRLEKKGGLGGIYPAMANSVIALRLLGYSWDHPLIRNQWKEIEELSFSRGETFFVQPCHSPVWDSALSVLALTDSGLAADHPQLQKAGEWLLSKQVSIDGDWKIKFPKIEGRGWYFQFDNEFYPDIDDTAAVILALKRIRLSDSLETQKEKAIQAGLQWIQGMQSSDGGWGAFDKDNNHYRLNLIPFADHGALLDPSTADVTARALTALRASSFQFFSAPIEKGLSALLSTQEIDGSWFGRWGANYIYGTWSTTAALKTHGFHPAHPALKKANDWLHLKQNQDGGWGESLLSYQNKKNAGIGNSTFSQTAWAIMALIATGEKSETVSLQRGVDYLLQHQNQDGTWSEKEFTGTGFPKVFYLKYHGYSLYFPLMALAQLRQLTTLVGPNL